MSAPLFLVLVAILWVPNIRPGTLTCDFVDAAVIV
jgi:hypothetical protein